jgi:hypothetical protein
MGFLLGIAVTLAVIKRKQVIEFIDKEVSNVEEIIKKHKENKEKKE